MKYFKILFSTLLLFCLVYTAEAQVIVTSTTAASEHSKSIRQKGLVVRPEFGVGFAYYSYRYGFSSHLLCDIDYQFNPYVSLGGGTGVIFFGNYNVLSLPLFAHLRGYFCNRKWSPYYDIKIGYNLSINSGSYKKDDTMYESVRVSGFYGSFGLGIQYKNFDFGFDISPNRFVYHFDISPNRFVYHFDYYSDKGILLNFNLNFAYNFQVKKKK